MPKVIVYLNLDAFAVPRDEYLATVALAKGDWTLVSEWIETHGTFIGHRPRSVDSLLPLEG